MVGSDIPAKLSTVPYRALVSCEHASNAVPDELNQLGLDDRTLMSHVAWDPGAKEVASHLAQAFDLPLILGQSSRLVADLNRSPDNAECVPANAFGVDVPGNTGLSAAAIAERIKRYHTPYWTEIETHILQAFDQGNRFLHLGVHSFVEEFQGQFREVDIGLLVDPDHPGDGPVAQIILEYLSRVGLDCRLNEPYDGRSDGITTNLRNRFPDGQYASVEFEINQRHLGDLDLIAKHFEGAVRATKYLDL